MPVGGRGANAVAAARAQIAPMACAATNSGTSCGRMPANVSEMARAMVTAGLVNDVEAVNQYAAAI